MSFGKSEMITTAVIVCILLLVGLAVSVSRTSQQNKEDASAAADSFSTQENVVYTNLDGEVIDLTQYNGSVRVVNSWASWCPFCVNELPDLQTLASEYKDKGVVVIAINRKENPTLAKKFIETLPPAEDIIFVLDAKDFFYKSIGGFSMPETIFYDVDGNIVVHKRGFMDIEEMRRHLEATLTSEGNN